MLMPSPIIAMSSSPDWQSYQDIDNSRIDAISGFMIYQLRLAGNEADVSTLKRSINIEAEERGRSDLEIDQTRQLNYRCEEHLIPLGLVAEVDPVDHDRPGEPPRRYALTGVGMDWYQQQEWHGQRLSVDLDNLRSRTESLADNINELDDSVGDLEDDVRELQSEDGGALAAARSNEDEISDLSDRLEEAYENDIYPNSQKIDRVEDNHDSRISDLSDEISDIKSTLDNIESWGSKLNSRLDAVEDDTRANSDKLDNLSASISQNSDRLDQLADNVDAAADTASQPSQTALRADRRANRLKWIIILQSVMLVAMIAAGALVFEGRI